MSAVTRSSALASNSIAWHSHYFSKFHFISQNCHRWIEKMIDERRNRQTSLISELQNWSIDVAWTRRARRSRGKIPSETKRWPHPKVKYLCGSNEQEEWEEAEVKFHPKRKDGPSSSNAIIYKYKIEIISSNEDMRFAQLGGKLGQLFLNPTQIIRKRRRLKQLLLMSIGGENNKIWFR